MITPITATFPALNFPKEVDYPTQEDWAAFNAAAELNYGILSGAWSDKSEEFKAQTNNLALEIQSIGENAISAITFDNIAQLKLNSNMRRVDVLGYYTKGDGGGGLFYWDSTSTEADNGGTIIQATGITTGRWKRPKSNIVNVKEFGAKGDGVTDDYNSFFKAISLSIPIYAPSSTYKINSELLIDNNTFSFIGDGDNTVLDFSSGGSLKIFSTDTSLPSLSQNITSGSNTITFSSSHGLVEGDVVIAWNPTDYSFSSYRNYYRDGQMFRVAKASTNTIVKTYGVSAKTYISSSMQMSKINGGFVSLKGFKIIPPSTGIALWIDLHQSVKLRDITIDAGSNNTAIEIYRCFDINIKNIKSTVNLGDAYPIIISNSQKVTADSLSLYSNRHCFAIGGRGSVPSRDILVSNSIFENDGTLGIGATDMHGGCENVIYSNCYINTAANMAGKNVAYLNCTIIGRPNEYFADGNCLFGSEIVGGIYRIEGCRFVTDGNTASFGAIEFTVNNRQDDFKLVFKDNIIENKGTTSSSARLVKINIGDSNPSLYRVDIVVDGLTYKSPNAGNCILMIAGLNDISAKSSYIVNNIDAPSGMPLIGFSLATNNRAPLKLQSQSFTTSVNTPANTSSQVISGNWTFKYPYPRSPIINVSAASDTGASQPALIGGKICVPFVYSYSNTVAKLSINSGDGLNFTSTAAVRLFAQASINEI